MALNYRDLCHHGAYNRMLMNFVMRRHLLKNSFHRLHFNCYLRQFLEALGKALLIWDAKEGKTTARSLSYDEGCLFEFMIRHFILIKIGKIKILKYFLSIAELL